MNNVFDLVSDFYSQDEEWNTVLQQTYVESFLRTKAWSGADDEKLIQHWDHITMLCLYLGNSENYLGDMTADDFIDCVAWCGRNVSEFTLTDSYVDAFMTTMVDLYAYLSAKKGITDPKAPVWAKEKLLVNGHLIMMDEEGIFYPKYDKYNKCATEDLPAKIFLNIGGRLQGLVEFLRTFFSDRKYRKDIERAAYLYSGIFLSGGLTEKPGTEEYAQCFWDYFLFDYIMIDEDKNPLEYFAEQVYSGKLGRDALSNKDILEELLKAELVLFSIEGINEDGLFACRNFMTGERYNLILPIDDEVDKDEYLFLGHIFYNKSMVMNFVRGMMISKTAQKRLLAVLNKAKNWFAVRNGGNLSWHDFIKRNTMFIRHSSLLFSAVVRLDSFNYTSDIKVYTPAKIDNEDRVCQLLSGLMSAYRFTKYDICLAQTMWSDFKKLTGKQIKVGELWAAAVIYNFIQANAVYNYDLDKVSEMCHNIPAASIKAAADEIKLSLAVEKHDPRYINEEGLLLMLLS